MLRIIDRLTGSMPALVLIIAITGGCQQAEQAATGSTGAAAPGAADVIALAVSGIGGEDALANLDGFSTEEERDYHIMGQGPEPGHGLMRLLTASLRVSHDLAGGQVRLDTTTSFPARGGGYDKRESTELVIGQAGYIKEEGFLGITKKKDKASPPDKTAGRPRPNGFSTRICYSTKCWTTPRPRPWPRPARTSRRAACSPLPTYFP